MGCVEIRALHKISGCNLFKATTHRAESLSVAEKPGLGGGNMHRFHRLKDHLTALLHHTKAAAGPGFAQVDASALIGGDHFLRISHGISPKWFLPIMGCVQAWLAGPWAKAGLAPAGIQKPSSTPPAATVHSA